MLKLTVEYAEHAEEKFIKRKILDFSISSNVFTAPYCSRFPNSKFLIGQGLTGTRTTLGSVFQCTG